jgi:two-component system, response regulator PdtaR
MNSKVMIVEDNGIFAVTLKKKLENWGYVPKIAFTGKQALEEMEIMDPDIIIMDVYLKGKLNGVETAKLIDDNFEKPIIYYSSCDEDEVSEHVKPHYNRDYIPKTLPDEDLKKTIENNLKKINQDQNNDSLVIPMDEKMAQNKENKVDLKLKDKKNTLKIEYLNETDSKPKTEEQHNLSQDVNPKNDDYEPKTDFKGLEKTTNDYFNTQTQIECDLTALRQNFLKVSDLASHQQEEISRLKEVETTHLNLINEHEEQIKMMKDEKQKLEDHLNNYKEKHQKLLSEINGVKSRLNDLTLILNE